MQEIVLKNVTKDYQLSEAYRTLRTNIEFSGADKKAIVFTGTLPNEGKSTVSLALAFSFAEEGKRTLFIDADLRKSVLVGRHEIHQEMKGLSHFLSGQAEVKDIIAKTQDPKLHVILSGIIPPNPTELLGSRIFEALLEGAKKTYDYIVIDAPPLGSVIDAAVIAGKCDAAVMVVAADKVSRKHVIRTRDQLEKAGCPILGVALNQVNMKNNKYYGKYYGDYYGSSGKK